MKTTGLPSDREGAVGGDFGEEVGVGLNLSEGRLEADRKAGQFTGTAVSDSKNDDAGGKPVAVTPKGIGLGVEIQVHPKIDVRDDRTTMILRTGLAGPDFLKGGFEVS